MNKKSLMTLSVLFLLSSVANAQGSSSLSMSAEKAKAKPSRFHLTAELSKSSNLYKETAAGQAGSTDFVLVPSYDLNSSLNLGLRTAISQEEVQGEERDTTLSNTAVNLRIKGPEITKDLSSGFLVQGVAPTNEKLRKSDSYQGGAALGGTLIYKKSLATLSYSLTGTRNFHQYTVSAEESPNIQYSLSQTLSLGLQLTKSLSLSANGLLKQGWTYRNFERRNSGFSAGVEYGFTGGWAVSTAVETAANLYKPANTDSNIKFYDQNTSVVTVGVSFTN